MIPTDWTPVTSSNVAEIKYDPQASDLHVKFKNGSVYIYAQVEPEEAEAMLHCSSPGQFIRNELSGYSYRRA